MSIKKSLHYYDSNFNNSCRDCFTHSSLHNVRQTVADSKNYLIKTAELNRSGLEAMIETHKTEINMLANDKAYYL